MNKPVIIKFVSNNPIAKSKSDSWSENIHHISKRVNTHHIMLRDSTNSFKLVMYDPVTLKSIYTTEKEYTKKRASNLWKEYMRSVSLVEIE
jgi:uncharacterized glyoxalase superfamily protein PhnB